ncbi:uncharacterized protein LOC111704460 [Eurytemora carolleeae]|uniref:uncharacterized protein LOC111704460 n=1 Tax=Eurytemora carolleeae TaxID=1294199 RepID=UPI000C77984E|nr:uncharacterized protein LOC111704460 [Eurytemora carolleeae]|eukprot:XP_023332465.1 uncharacterized protein LOC111704460 [Eurytemora affinis]
MEGVRWFLLFTFLGIVSCQKFRLFPASYKPCAGALTVNSVQISAPQARQENCKNRHLLVKGRRVQICMNATLPLQDPPVNIPVLAPAGLKNSAHGTVPGIPIPQDFCDIAKDACENATPPCSEWAGGMNVMMCSALRVPDDPILLNPLIQPDVLVRWRIIHEPNSDLSTCETRYDAQPKQTPLLCIDIEAKVVNEPRCPPPILG